MATQVKSPAEPTMHVDPYESAKELRVILRKMLTFLNDQSTPSSTSDFARRATDYTNAAVTRLNDAQEQLDVIKQQLPGLEESIKARRIAEGTARLQALHSSCDHATRLLRDGKGYLSHSSSSQPTALHWLKQISKPASGSTQQQLKTYLRRARVIAQALPTTPMNATVPAEVVVNALVAILHNFKLVEPNPDAKKVAPAVAVDKAEKAIAFEDEYGVSMEEYIQINGELPEGWED